MDVFLLLTCHVKTNITTAIIVSITKCCFAVSNVKDFDGYCLTAFLVFFCFNSILAFCHCS